jgi:hypothetical protein
VELERLCIRLDACLQSSVLELLLPGLISALCLLADAFPSAMASTITLCSDAIEQVLARLCAFLSDSSFSRCVRVASSSAVTVDGGALEEARASGAVEGAIENNHWLLRVEQQLILMGARSVSVLVRGLPVQDAEVTQSEFLTDPIFAQV